MVNCTFCGDDMPQGTGKMYVKNDGKLLHFCSMKCEKNMIKLGRKPLRTKWTEENRVAKQAAKTSKKSTDKSKTKN